MTLPITIPNTFANATASIPLSQLDNNFSTVVVAVNGIGNGAESLSNVSITGGSVANVTLANVSISGETLDNVTLTNVSITSGNATFTTANVTTLDLTNIEVTNIKAKDGTAAIAIADSTGVTTQSTPAIISVNSASDALRITQVGAGNALLVEDSANPDATPFVVNADGRAIIGNTVSVGDTFGTSSLQVQTTGGNALSLSRYSADAFSSVAYFVKSRGALGAQGAVSSGDGVGTLLWTASDGTGFIQAASISSAVDGTPGTNDMPGRLVFSTTADGASTPTERMRIDNAGRVGIGSTSTATYALRVSVPVFGGTSAQSIFTNGVIQSDVTGSAWYNRTNLNTAAASFTLTSAVHYQATQATIGAGSTVTTQYGFNADASLTGATNNIGFYSNIASGTGRWNFFANGTANNFFAGQVQLGAGTVSAPALSTTGDTNTGIFFPAADTIAFAEGGAEAMRIDSSGNVLVGITTARANAGDVQVSKGISFPATQSASSDANTLDDYEEGSWTPTAYGGTTTGTTTYATQLGRYTKIGNMVFIEVFIEVSAMTGTGALYFSVPFAPVGEPRGVGNVWVSNLDWQNAGSICFLTQPNEVWGRLFVSSDNAVVSVVNVENAAWEIRFSVAYTV